MTKKEAVEKWVREELNPISQDWVERLFVSFNGYAPTLPMWGTMFILSEFDAKRFVEHTRRMAYSPQNIDLDNIEENEGAERRKVVEKAIEDDDWSVLEDYIDEEMSGELCILDKDGDPTAAYLYELDGEYIVGVDGAGWDFYDGVWDRLYDLTNLNWHKED